MQAMTRSDNKRGGGWAEEEEWGEEEWGEEEADTAGALPEKGACHL
jgi:hypothetical protein